MKPGAAPVVVSIIHVSGLVHVGLAVIALASGPVQLALPKGTPAHRKLGWP